MSDETTTKKDESGPQTANRLLDHSVLLSFVDGDEDLLRDICALFLTNYPGFISAIRAAIQRNDGNALARAAHTLKGSGGYFLTDSALKMLNDLELIARGDNLTGAPAQLVDLEAALERLKPEWSMVAGDGFQSKEE